MSDIDNNYLNENPEAEQGENAEHGKKSRSERPSSFFSRSLELLLQLGLGESTLRLASNALLLIVVVGVVFLMRGFYTEPPDSPSGQSVLVAEPTPISAVEIEEAPVALNVNSGGIPRMALIHTTIPSRPRLEVTTYDVQEGDTVFGIGEKYGLTPQTILWSNYNILLDDPHNLRAGQELSILPVDGTYYEWQDGDGLNGVAEFFGVAPDEIVNYAANRLDKEALGDYALPNIVPGTRLIVPGGERLFISWSAPIGVTREDPASSYILGDGACEPITGGAVGFGTFVWPAANHYLSGYDWSPETNHRGIDIAGHEGAGIFAVDAGVVVYSGWNNYGYGNVVMLDHGTGFQSMYAHLSAIYVGCGQSVGQGESIGAFGSTGRSSGAHLHFELMTSIYGKVNPWDFLPPP
ncbi:MAG: peptidoglycan DD-metalloendopeptidase family protein [Anaerolineae bacterium]|jgi:murein DD-endopeptidase MepM/ murein hydrolase activator NlpD|nr:peptidoglycan DD-metalloendopeptidase family protein [Anaerolineae bacterium]MBT7072863.1 peptidoglycan DD-metalloendopeptidase family protein [Anaerolineae bacterium]MBT7326306.1 peptidoglycan DD-metalloendopeptidase family protein [Anaerolineae bacterium]